MPYQLVNTPFVYDFRGQQVPLGRVQPGAPYWKYREDISGTYRGAAVNYNGAVIFV